MMHTLNSILDWMRAGNGTNATLLLVLITALYAGLTWRMARAMSQQTRAMIQPVVSLHIVWEPEFNPKGYFVIKNIGLQPLLLKDIYMTCNGHGLHLTRDFTLWDEHVLGPSDSLAPLFDFIPEIERALRSRATGGFWRGWSPGDFGYSLEVVTTDLSKKVVNRYTSIPVLKFLSHGSRLPLRVRSRYLKRGFVQRYTRFKYRFNRPR